MMKNYVLLGMVAFVVLGELALGLTRLLDADISVYFFYFDIIILAMIPAHAGLISLWVAMAGKLGPWRLPVATFAIVRWMNVAVELREHGDFGWMYFILLLMVGLLSALLMVARLCGAELTNVKDEQPEADDPDHRWLQFTLSSMFSWTTALAVIMAMLRYVPRNCYPGPLWGAEEYASIFWACLGGILVLLSATWLALGSRWTIARWVVAIGALLAIIDLWAVENSGGGRAEFMELAVFFIAQAVWMIVPLRLLHMVGYRLTWRRRTQF